MKIVLAFDIERSGSTNEYDTIAIGASVVDENLHELDRFVYLSYITNETRFEDKCMKEFWSKHLDILNTLKYTGPLNKQENESNMINEFQQFRSKWESYCKENSHQYYLVSDNTIYDGGFINMLIYKYMKKTLPIPYSAKTQQYDDLYETTSIMKGLLLSNNVESDNNMYKTLQTIYNIPNCPILHNHNPANDAFNIGFQAQVLLNINKYTKI